MAAAAPAAYDLTLARLFEALDIKDPCKPESGKTVTQFLHDLRTKLTLQKIGEVIKKIKDRQSGCNIQLSFIAGLVEYPTDSLDIPGVLPLKPDSAHQGEKSLLAMVLLHDLSALPAYFALADKVRPQATAKHTFFYDDLPLSLFHDAEKFSAFLRAYSAHRLYGEERYYSVAHFLVSEPCRANFFMAREHPLSKAARKELIQAYAHTAVAGDACYPPLTRGKVDFEQHLPYLYLKYLLAPEEVALILRAAPSGDNPYFYWAALLPETAIEGALYPHFCSREAFVPFYWLLRERPDKAIALLQTYCTAHGGGTADVSFMHRNEEWSLLAEAFYQQKDGAVLAVLSQSQRLNLARQITHGMVFFNTSDGAPTFHNHLLHFCARTLDQTALDRLLPEDASRVKINFQNPPPLNAVLYRRLCTVEPKPEKDTCDLILHRYFLRIAAYYQEGKLQPDQVAQYEKRLRHFLHYLNWCDSCTKDVEYPYPHLEEELITQGILNRMGSSNGYADAIRRLDAARYSSVQKTSPEKIVDVSCNCDYAPDCQHALAHWAAKRASKCLATHKTWIESLRKHAALLEWLAPLVYWRLREITQGDPSLGREALLSVEDKATAFPTAAVAPGIENVWEWAKQNNGRALHEGLSSFGADAFVSYCMHSFFLHTRMARELSERGLCLLLDSLHTLLDNQAAERMRALLTCRDQDGLTLLQRFCGDDPVRAQPKPTDAPPALFLCIERHDPDLVYAQDLPAHASPRTRQAYARSYMRTRGLASCCQFLEKRPVFDPAGHSIDFKTYLASLEPQLTVDAAGGRSVHPLETAFWKLHFCLMNEARNPVRASWASISFSRAPSPYVTALDILAKLTLAMEGDQPIATAVEKALAGRGEGAAVAGSLIEVAETFCTALRDAAATQHADLEQVKTLFRHYLALLHDINPRLYEDLEEQRKAVTLRQAEAEAEVVAKAEAVAMVASAPPLPAGGPQPSAPPLAFTNVAMNGVDPALVALRLAEIDSLRRALAENCSDKEWQCFIEYLRRLSAQVKQSREQEK